MNFVGRLFCVSLIVSLGYYGVLGFACLVLLFVLCCWDTFCLGCFGFMLVFMVDDGLTCGLRRFGLC